MRYFLSTLFLSFVLCFVVPSTSYAYCEYFDDDIKGATGFSACTQNVYLDLNTKSKLKTITEGEQFVILDEIDNYWKIYYDDIIGYINTDYCMINLPDVLYNVQYYQHYAVKDVVRCNGIFIPNDTDMIFYKTGKVWNERLGKKEFIMPMLYSAAKMVAEAEYYALQDNYTLKIYDTYRPHSVTIATAIACADFYNNYPEYRKYMDYSEYKGQRYYWGQGWFTAQNVSTHNTGAALDVTLVDLETQEECIMPSGIIDLSVKALKYYSSGCAKIPENYAETMTDDAKLLDSYFVKAGMGTLASEWWHFQDNSGYKRIVSNNFKGCDFKPVYVNSVSVETIEKVYNILSSLGLNY